MINNPQLGLPQVEISVETPLASVAVTVGGGPESDAIVVNTAPSAPAGSLLDAALGEAPAPAPFPSAFTQSASAYASAGSPADGSAASPGASGGPGNGAAAGAYAQNRAGLPVASNGISANAQLGASFAARSLEATLASFATSSAALPGASLLGNGALARLLVAAALGQPVATAGLSKGAATTLATAAALLRAASSASPTAAAAATMLAELDGIVGHDAAELARAAVLLQQQAAPQQTGIALPSWDPSARLGRADKKKAVADVRADEDERDRPVVLPDRDPQGRPYDARQRMRLARLAADPRSGYAPEGRVALAAEIEHGVRLERTYDTAYDFADATGGRWQTFEPRSVAGLEGALGRAGGSHTIVSAASLDAADRVALDALIERLTLRAGAPRILIVNGGER